MNKIIKLKIELFFILLTITSSILNKLIKLRCFKFSKYLIDFRKNYIIYKLKRLITYNKNIYNHATNKINN